MTNCLTCGEPIEQKPGKRKRIYCSDLCRVRYFQRNGKRPVKAATVNSKVVEPTVTPNEAILKQIAAIKAESIPYYRNSVLGKKTWEAEQRQRIIDLESKLK